MSELVFAADDVYILAWEMADITAISQHATTPLLTAYDHPFTAGETVLISEVVGTMSSVLNGNSFTVQAADLTPHLLQIGSVDTSSLVYTSGGIVRKVLTSDWIYVRKIEVIKNPESKVVPQWGANYPRFVTKSNQNHLVITRAQTGYDDDWGFISEDGVRYMFEIKYWDRLASVYESKELRNCVVSRQSLRSGSEENAINRRWTVGTINKKT